VQDVTSDERLLRRAATSLKAADATYRNSDTYGMSEKAAAEYMALYMRERVLAVKHAFQAIARHLASVPGRKNLVWITEGFPLLYSNSIIGCIDFSPDVEEAANELNGANVALYAVDARGLIGALGQMTGIPNAESGGPRSPEQVTQRLQNQALRPAGPSHIETMNLLAGRTGGDVYFNTNGIEDSLQKAVEDGDVTYSLGFYPPDASQDGQVHTLSVKAAKRGVNLRYRENYLAPKPRSDAENRPTLEQLLKYPLDATQIGLRAQATPDQAKSGFFDVHVSVDLRDVHLDLADAKWIGAVKISFVVENSKSAQAATRTIEIPEDQLAAALEEGITFVHSIQSEGKAGDVRVVIEDKATGAAGSLRIPLGKK
jgi:VWFA-related protein